MRALLFATAALLASPTAAQDHAGHQMPMPPEQDAPEEQPAKDGSQMDHAQMDHGAMDHAQMDHGAMDHSMAKPGEAKDEPLPASGPPPRAFEGPQHAADAVFGTAAMEPARAELVKATGEFSGGTAMLDRLEARLGQGKDAYLWDAQGWYGGDTDKLWLKSEGEGEFTGGVEQAEVQALWSHAIGPWFDLQTGVRADIEPNSRAHAVLGVQGLAPYMFEIDAAAFLSDKSDLTGRIEAEYDQRITQRLILQPRAELELSAQSIPELGLGSGVTSIETGLRLRYEFQREFAPYIGVGYEAKLGGTADFARAAGDDPDRFVLLLGLRAWF